MKATRTHVAIAALAVACALGMAPAAAENDALKDSFKKTERGFGELLRGMGQELKRGADAIRASGKKQDKKAAKPASKQD